MTLQEYFYVQKQKQKLPEFQVLDNTKLYIKIPYEHKTIGLKHRAYFDGEKKSWYIPPFMNLEQAKLTLFHIAKELDVTIDDLMPSYSIFHDCVRFKPDGYKTPRQWMEQDKKVPVDDRMIESCWVYGKNGEKMTYQYIAPCLVRDATPQEIEGYKAAHSHKKQTVNASVPFHVFQNIVQRELDKIPAQHIANPTNIVCFDTETTGLSPDKGDELVQITIFDGQGNELINTFVKPYMNTEWDGAMKVNHISPDMVENAPYPHEIAPQIRDIFNSAEIIVGYNVGFDINFVSKCLGYSFEGKIIEDPCADFKELHPEGKHKLRDAILRYAPEELDAYDDDAHKADTDARATIAVWKAVCKEKEQLELQQEEIER